MRQITPIRILPNRSTPTNNPHNTTSQILHLLHNRRNRQHQRIGDLLLLILRQHRERLAQIPIDDSLPFSSLLIPPYLHRRVRASPRQNIPSHQRRLLLANVHLNVHQVMQVVATRHREQRSDRAEDRSIQHHFIASRNQHRLLHRRHDLAQINTRCLLRLEIKKNTRFPTLLGAALSNPEFHRLRLPVGSAMSSSTFGSTRSTKRFPPLSPQTTVL